MKNDFTIIELRYVKIFTYYIRISKRENTVLLSKNNYYNYKEDTGNIVKQVIFYAKNL